MERILYIEPSLTRALELKRLEGCPHIHFSTEEECDSFTESLIWLEVLDRGAKATIEHGKCIVSFTKKSKNTPHLTIEESRIISSIQKKTTESLRGIKVIENGDI